MMKDKILQSIAVDILPKKTQSIIFCETEIFRPKSIQYLDWRLLQFMYDRFFRYGKSCSMSAKRLAYILGGAKCSEGSIRNSRARLKKEKLITVQNMKSDFSNKTVSYCFITEQGDKIMKGFFNKKNSIDIQEESTIPKEPSKQYKYNDFDYKVSRRYIKRIQKAYLMKSTVEWSEECADVIRKLREIDKFTEQEITDTIDHILSDNIPRNGFCLAKVLRSPLQFRSKWKNGLTKFCSAYEDMKAKKLSNPSIDDEETLPVALRECYNSSGKKEKRKVFDPPRSLDSNDFVDEKINQLYEDLMCLPHPDWKLNSPKFLEYEQYCFDVSLLFEEFILDRNWDMALPSQFTEVLNVDNKGLKFFTTDILREKTIIFFKERIPKFFAQSVGKFNQIRKHYIDKRDIVMYDYDDSYCTRVEDFIEDQKILDPFKRATIIYDDDEVEMDYNWKKYKKGEFNG